MAAQTRRIRRIVGLGLSVVDHLYVVDGLDLGRTRTPCSAHLCSSGGMVGNALLQSAQLGCNTHILSLVGDDPDGRFLRTSLRRAGVKTGRLILSGELPTTIAVVLVERRTGERRFLVPNRRALERRAPDFDLSPIARGTLLLVDGHFTAQALRAVRRARQVGATVIADFHEPRAEYLRLLPYVDHPVLPLEFVEAWGVGDPEQTLRRLHADYGGTPVITLGRRGGLVFRDGRVHRYRAQRVPGGRVRDTTGAGDAFHGALAAGLYHGLGLPAALDLGARAAALNCSAVGANARLMTRDEMGAAHGAAQ